MDIREYRYYYIKIDKKELESSIISHMRTVVDKDEDNEETAIFGDLLYAIGDSLTGESGDSYYNPDFQEKVKYLSKLYPDVTFTAGWINNDNNKDKEEFVVKNGNLL